jgi:hypothetical protein
MQIQVLSVEVNTATSKAGKPYEQVVVAYKDLDNGGKVASKTIMPFGFQKDTFTTMKSAKPVEVYDVEVQKNEAGYNDWIRAKKGAATNAHPSNTNVGAAVSATSSTTSKGGWETPEERAKKQIYIVRQSSVSAAINLLTAHAKTTPKVEDVIDIARQFEAFVFESDSAKATASKDVGSIETMDEDIPY